jgi:hypothetical protein
MKKRLQRLDITLEDVAKEAGVSMHVIYTDVKRNKLDKNSLSSVIEYVLSKRPDKESGPTKGEFYSI